MDRNLNFATCWAVVVLSLSARRAWIEIFFVYLLYKYFRVALRKESVDRNRACDSGFIASGCRSPQGERG